MAIGKVLSSARNVRDGSCIPQTATGFATEELLKVAWVVVGFCIWVDMWHVLTGSTKSDQKLICVLAGALNQLPTKIDVHSFGVLGLRQYFPQQEREDSDSTAVVNVAS
jgi:hypothetical protein